MGKRKAIAANARKEALKTVYFAKLRNVPTSPRKMRLVVDMIRGMGVNLTEKANYNPNRRPMHYFKELDESTGEIVSE